MGSCTKSMTAMLAALMVEQGKLRWDTTLGEAFAGSDVQLHPDFQKVTIAQLLGHRAGIPKDMVGRPLWIKLRSGGLSPVEQRHLITQTYLGEEPVSPPGTKFEYTNVGYVIVGHIIERMEGKPYEELMRENIFKPLGLSSAGFGPPLGDAEPRGHRNGVPVSPEKRSADNPEGLAPAGRAHMSLQDWVRYAQIHLRAARGESYELLTEASYKKLHTPLEGQTYALGWGSPNRRWAGGRVLTHVGSNTMWRCAIWIVPEKNAAILVTTNHGGDEAEAGEKEVIQTIIKQLFPTDGEQ
ncbi:MAG: serine hydrolase domain-containing protein [Phycisphaerales bacterium]